MRQTVATRTIVKNRFSDWSDLNAVQQARQDYDMGYIEIATGRRKKDKVVIETMYKYRLREPVERFPSDRLQYTG